MSKTNLLLDSQDLLILQTQLAVVIGDRHAIALQQIHYWLEANERVDKQECFFDGYWWVCNTWDKWQKHNFPFWSDKTLRRIFKDLELDNLIVTYPHDNRNLGVWVRIDYDKLSACAEERGYSLKISRIERRKSASGSGQNDHTGSGQNDQPGVVKMTSLGGQNDQPNEGEIATETKETIKETIFAHTREAADAATTPPPAPPVRVAAFVAADEEPKTKQEVVSALDSTIRRQYKNASYLTKSQITQLSVQIARYEADSSYREYVDNHIRDVREQFRKFNTGATFESKPNFIKWLLDEAAWEAYDRQRNPHKYEPSVSYRNPFDDE